MEAPVVNFKQVSIFDFMKALPKSERLCLRGEYYIKNSNVAEAPPLDHLRALYCNNCCLDQLQKVNITVETAFERALDFTQFLLANSSSLEILIFEVFDCLEQLDTPTLLSILRVLLRMERASQRAAVELLYNGLAEQ